MDKIFPFEQPEESTGFLLWQVSNLWHLAMKKALDPLNLTFTQFSLLAALQWLSEHYEIVTQQDIANHAKTDKMTTSKVLRTLQDKKFVVRSEHQVDTRAKTVKISDLGLQLLKKALPLVNATDKAFFKKGEKKKRSFKKHLTILYRA